MLAICSRRRHFAAVAAGATLFAASSVFALATTATAAAGQIGLQPNHRIAPKPTGGGHGSGGGGGASAFPGWTSSNWSGYATTSPTPFTGVTGAWAVPSVSPTRSATYSAAWLGIDGFNNNSLIQTGTEQDYYNGSAHYVAWWTTSAQKFAEQTITTGCSGAGTCGKVAPTDAIKASISENTVTGLWSMTLTDTTQSWSFTKTVAYSGPGTSAEWILEAPTVGGRIAPLAHYSTTTFDPGTVDGNTNPSLIASDGGEMVQGFPFSQVVSIPSNPDLDTDGFNINYGPTAPSPPA